VESSAIGNFIERWQKSGAAERANYQLFLMELCDLLGVERPHPAVADDSQNTYVFERAVTFQNPDGTTSPGRIDLYKRGCFVLEAKQGSDEPAPLPFRVAEPSRRRRGTARRGTKSYDESMVAARYQAEEYARALPDTEGWPPFIVVVDVGHSIQLFSNFARSGKSYVAFPDPQSFRITLGDLEKPDVRERLRLVWTRPLALDPSVRSAKVTREIAEQLAKLAKSLEASRHDPAAVAQFLIRCLFTMFAEDVELLPRRSFSDLLEGLRQAPEFFAQEVSALWHDMARGGYSVAIKKRVPHFNGGLFDQPEALSLNREQQELLIEAARADWRDVEPAIFGTLLERALDPAERHKLGAHFTPRSFVERLVIPTVVEPLREDWAAVQAAAHALVRQDNTDKAGEEVRKFHERLCNVRVLDPACGSGNFLYVTLEHLKRLEGEVLNALCCLSRSTTGGFSLQFPGRARPDLTFGRPVNRPMIMARSEKCRGGVPW